MLIKIHLQYLKFFNLRYTKQKISLKASLKPWPFLYLRILKLAMTLSIS